MKNYLTFHEVYRKVANATSVPGTTIEKDFIIGKDSGPRTPKSGRSLTIDFKSFEDGNRIDRVVIIDELGSEYYHSGCLFEVYLDTNALKIFNDVPLKILKAE